MEGRRPVADCHVEPGVKSSFEHGFPPYLGQEPYLHLCFSDADAAMVQPLMLRLHDRSVRLWYER